MTNRRALSMTVVSGQRRENLAIAKLCAAASASRNDRLNPPAVAARHGLATRTAC